MSLKDRLDRLTGDASKAPVALRRDRMDELRLKLDRIMDRRGRSAQAGVAFSRVNPTPLEHVVAGQEIFTGKGSFFLSKSRAEAGDLHGRARVCDASRASMEAAAFFAGVGITSDMSIGDGLFIDTETTGLAGGTGTFPFLIGLGWFEAGSFVTCQLFARDFSEEGAMLAYLGELAGEKRFLVSFNGKAYDLNLLGARFILNRCFDRLTSMPHIDLLHPSRRVLSHRLENVRLSTIETHVLGLEREKDIPGIEIPQRYFDWLRKRDGSVLKDVFKHNRLDVLSMASLLKYLADLVEGCFETGRNHHGDLLRLAGLFYERGEDEKATGMFEALTLSHYKEVSVGARRSLSLIYKKAGRREEAVDLWQGLVDSNPYDFFAVEELQNSTSITPVNGGKPCFSCGGSWMGPKA